MSADNEIKVLLTADLAQLKAGMEAGAATVAESTEAMTASVAAEAAAFNAAVQTKIDAMVRVNAAFSEGITSTAGIAAAEAALDQAMAAGALTASEYSGYIATLDIAEADLAAAAAAATVAVEANTAAVAINGGVAREVGVMIGELARGNYTRLEGSTITLANRTGVLSTALQSIMSPIGLATVAAAALGYEVFEAGADFRAMEGSVIATGEAAGYTAGQLDVMASSVGKATGDTGAADEAFLKLAQSGRFAGNDLRLVGTAAAEMAAMTGQSVGSIISQIEKLQEDPLKAVAKLNDQFHFLTVAEYEQMQQMVAAGDTAGAASIAYAAMADNMGVKTEQVHEHVNVLVKAFRDLKNTWNDTMRSANVALGGGDTAEQLAEAQKILKNMQDQNAALLQVHSHSAGLTEELKNQTARVTELTAKLHEESAAAGSVGDAAQKSAAQIDAMAKAHKGHDDHDKTQADRDEFNEQRLQRTMSLDDEKDYWEKKREAAAQGTQEYRQAVQQLLEIKGKEATLGREAARREQEDARRSADFRISTEKEVQDEIQAEAKKQQQLSLEKLKASHDEATGDIANKREQYQNEYADGQLSASQLLQLENALVAQKLAIDAKYLADKKKLDEGDVLAQAKDDAAIVTAKQSAQSQLAKNEKEYLKNSQKEWSDHAKKIEGAMQGAITGILFQHQTLQKELANIVMVIGEDFIQQAVMKPVDKWIEGEAQKISASLTTQATLQTQRAADSAAEAARGAASVVRASGVAGAMGTASFAGAPWPIDMGAPAFGAGMAAAAASYAPMASARGGWERVPFDGAMTELHKDEMVLPAHIANPMRQMAMQGGQGGGGNSYHFHSFDSNGIYDHARRRPAEFAKAMKHVARRGHLR
jgi:phage-related minor tail protein